jgi:riboflavin kinase/FMN adenylyltransferase
MKIIRQFGSNRQAPSPCLLTIGSFDGVHRGHQTMLRELVQTAKQHGLQSAVMTFFPHPRTVLRGEPVPQLDTLRERLSQLKQLGIDRVYVVRFSRDLADKSADDFLQILKNRLQMKELWVGADFAFGRGREGNVSWLQKRAALDGFELRVCEDVIQSHVDHDVARRISSSWLREALAQGDLNTAKQLLGRDYAISGRVVHGQKLGRTLDCPTININPPQACPARGVFVVEVGDLEHSNQVYQGVASLGSRPSVNVPQRLLLEVHLLDASGDWYGKRVRVRFLHKIRDEQKFDSLDDLKQAMQQDVEMARAWFL